MKKNPEISVMMVFYNSERYIKETIESILNQTFRNFELLLINDGSTDNSVKIVENFHDERVRLVNSKHDYINSLNVGMRKAFGKYIARMDADDIMHPDRLLVQHTLMEENPEVDICSSWCTMFVQKLGKAAIYRSVSGLLQSPLLLLLDRNFITHPCMMFRTESVRKFHLRYERYPYAEDYKLSVEAAKKGAKFYIEPQSLLHYRCHEEQISIKKKTEQDNTAIRIKGEIMDFILPRIPKELQDLYKCFCEVESMGYSKPNYKFAQMYKLLDDNCIKI